MKKKKLFNIIKSNMDRKKDIFEGISYLKGINEYEIKEYTFNRLKVNSKYSSFIRGVTFPKHIEEMYNKPKMYFVNNFESNLQWYMLQLRDFIEIINLFEERKIKFEKELLQGNYNKAEIILHDIETSIGFSFWLLENKILLLQEKYGLEKQKSYVKEIKENDKINNLVKYWVSYISVKNEPSVSYDRFRKLCYEVKEESDYFYEFFRFKLDCYSDISYSNLSYLFYCVDNEGIIDKYLLLKKIVEIITINKGYEEYKKLLIKNFDCLEWVENHEFSKLLKRVKKEDKHWDVEFLRIIDLYTTGNYKKILEEKVEIFEKFYNNLDIFEIYVKSLIRIGETERFEEGNIKGRLLNNLTSLYFEKHLFEDAFQNAKKILLIYNSHSWSLRLYYILKREFGEFLDENEIDLGNLSYISIKKHNPLEILDESFIGVKEHSITCELYMALKNRNVEKIKAINIPADRKERFICKVLIENKQYSEAIRILERINVSDARIKGEVKSELINLYMKIGNDFKLVEMICETYLENRSLFRKLPIESTIRNLKTIKNEEKMGRIEIPILYELYTRYCGADKEYKKFIEYRKFLKQIGSEKPSAINLDKFERNKIIFFLDKICKIDLMANDVEKFDSSESVREERVKICETLSIIDKSNDKKYLEEIINIKQDEKLEKGLENIEIGKISIDLEGLNEFLSEQLRSTFDRYLELEYTDEEIEKEEYITLSVYEEEGIEVKIASSDKRSLFHLIIVETRDEFTQNKRYGLKSILSTQIKHGILKGQIRKVFEEAKLITEKKEENENYETNIYWNEKYFNLSRRELKKLNVYLNEFSQKVDDYIKKINEKMMLIVIKDEDKSGEGLFDFTLDVTKMDLWEKENSKVKSIESLIAYLNTKMMNILEKNLVNTKKVLIEEVTSNFISLINVLQKKVNEFDIEFNLGELNNNINNLRTNIQKELIIISEWFNVPQDKNMADYEIDYALDIALEFLKNTSSKEIEVEREIKSVLLTGRTFKHMVYILYNLIHNIVKHWRFCNINPTAKLKISLEGGRLVIYIENRIKSQQVNNKIFDNLELLNDNDKISSSAAEEGGSGFHKIKKIVNCDLGSEFEIDYGYIDDSIFYVELLLKGEFYEHINNRG